MMDQLEVISEETPQLIKYCMPVTMGQTLFKDAHEYARKCKVRQTAVGRERKTTFPLQPVNIQQPFEQWGLDIIGEITPKSSKQHKYILTATDYFTKWVESIH